MPRFNLTLSPQGITTLESLARKYGKTKAEVVRDALALEEWFEAARAEGDRILVERDGQLREIVFRPVLREKP